MPPEKGNGVDVRPPMTTPGAGVAHPASVVAVEMTPIVPVRVFNTTGEYFDTETHLYAPMNVLQWAIEDFFKVKPETQQLLYNREPIDPTRSLHENGCLLLKGEPYVKIVFTIKRGPLLNIVCHWSRAHEEVPIACLETSTIAEVKQILYDELLQRYRRRRVEEEEAAAKQAGGRSEDGAGVASPCLPPAPLPPPPSRMRVLWRYMELNDKATLEYYRVPTNAAFFVLLKRGIATAKQKRSEKSRQESHSSRTATGKANSAPFRGSVPRDAPPTGTPSFPASEDTRLSRRRGGTPPPLQRETVNGVYSSSPYYSSSSIPVVPSCEIVSSSHGYPSSASPPISATAPTPPPPLQDPQRRVDPSYSASVIPSNYRPAPPFGYPLPADVAVPSPSQGPSFTASYPMPPNGRWEGGSGIYRHAGPGPTAGLVPVWPSPLPSSFAAGAADPRGANSPSQGMWYPQHPGGERMHSSPYYYPPSSPYGERMNDSAFRTMAPPPVRSPTTAVTPLPVGFPAHLSTVSPYSLNAGSSGDSSTNGGGPSMPFSDCAAGVESMRMAHALQDEIRRLQHEIQTLRQVAPPHVPVAPPNFHSSISQERTHPTNGHSMTETPQNTMGFPHLSTSLAAPLLSQEHAEKTLMRIEQLESSVLRLQALLEKLVDLVQ